MKFNWSAFVTNPVYQIGGVVGILILVGGIAWAQKSCGKAHEQAATVEGAKADASAERLKDALQEIEGLHRKVADLETAGRAYKLAYERAKTKIPILEVRPPSEPGELALALRHEGFQEGVRVEGGITASILTEADAGLTYLLAQQAKRLESTEAALAACDLLQQNQEATLQAKDFELNKTNEALRASMEESAHRQMQAIELGRALSVQKKKGWQKYGALALGVVVGYAAAKH